MKIQDNQNIKVLNYGNSAVAAKGENKEYLFEGSFDGIPTVFYMSFKEIEYINSRSTAFRSGTLEFDESLRDDIYTALNMPDWKETVLFESVIEDLILNPTEENLKRITAIRDIFVFERIRGKLVYFTNEGIKDISNKVINVVNQRFKEINSGVAKSKIIFKKETAVPVVENEKVAALEEQLAQMQEMMERMMKAQNIEVENDAQPSVELEKTKGTQPEPERPKDGKQKKTDKTSEKKPAGRPPKK